MMSDLPIESLTTAQIKDELRNLYAVTDLSDCLETKDLHDKLTTVRRTQLVTHGLRYGPLLQIGNKQNPSGIVTLSHGLGDSAHGWEDVAAELSRALPHLLFLLPTAPTRAVTINGGMSMPAWYDIMDLRIGAGGREDGKGVLASAAYVASVAHTAAHRHRVPSGRVVFAGFSQGAAVSLAAGLTARVAPAGIAVLSGYLAAAADVLPAMRNRSAKVFMGHGTRDPVVPFAAAQKTREALEAAGVTSISFNTYEMEHSAHPKEIDDVKHFLRQVLPQEFSKS